MRKFLHQRIPAAPKRLANTTLSNARGGFGLTPGDYAWDEAIDFWESVFGEGSTEAQAIAHCIVDGACD